MSITKNENQTARKQITHQKDDGERNVKNVSVSPFYNKSNVLFIVSKKIL